MFKRRKPDDAPGATPMPQPKPAGAAAPIDRPDVGMPSPSPFKPPAAAGDPGVGMPQPRPAPKEAPVMGRTPYPAPPQPTPPAPTPPSSIAPGGRPGVQPGRARDPERRTLVVGHGISVQGTVQDAERLVVEGTVEASMIHATELSIAQGGVFKGAVEVEDAEIAGTIDGTLTARGNLVVRATGKVLGTANYRRLQVEDGGQISGELKMIMEPARAAGTRPLPTESAA